MNMKTAAEMVVEVLKAEGVTQRDLAEMVGRTASSISVRLKNNTIPAQTLFEYASLLGYEVILRKLSTGEELRSTQSGGAARRVRRMVGKTIYDTGKATPICATEERDGWSMGLFLDDEGRFFVAHYTNWPNAEDFISQVGKDDARAFYFEHGDGSRDELFKTEIEPED